jgi:alpha-glucosidase
MNQYLNLAWRSDISSRGLACMLGCILPFALLLTGCATPSASNDLVLASPDGSVVVEFSLDANGAPVYQVKRDQQAVLQESKLGLVRDDADFARGLKLVKVSKRERVHDDYEILTAKRRHNHYDANRKVFHLATASGKKLDIIFQVSNDGVAFRYVFPETAAEKRSLTSEGTSFHLPAGARAWLQPMSVAKSGWMRTNPSYEEYYAQDIPAGTPSTLKAGWVFPALFRAGDVWVLISETGLGRNYCGTRLQHESPDGEYFIGFADPRETQYDLPVNPSSSLPWVTPWRIIVVGSLKTVVESTLGIDLADPPTVKVGGAIAPGKASWSWPLLGDGQTVYDVQKRFIDYAAEMGWAYCLIDSMWDGQIGYEKIKELADYAATKHVGLLLWYNSNGSWNDAPQTPKNKLLTHESRVEEFKRLQAMGIKGLKVDFFSGDGQPVINLYHDLLEDSAPFGLLMNFHGATLPRGWQRTYPHLMTMESIKGFEFITFDQRNADQAPTHCAMLPFTRNVFDPMDFTPVSLDKIPRIQRRTSPAFELALSVLFTSGIQHYPEIPEGMAKQPEFVKTFMKSVPSVWDDTRFIDGMPGRFVVLARQSGGRWYIAGINAESVAKEVDVNLSALGVSGKGSLITDATGEGYEQRTVEPPRSKMLYLTIKPRGGFVIELSDH